MEFIPAESKESYTWSEYDAGDPTGNWRPRHKAGRGTKVVGVGSTIPQLPEGAEFNSCLPNPRHARFFFFWFLPTVIKTCYRLFTPWPASCWFHQNHLDVKRTEDSFAGQEDLSFLVTWFPEILRADTACTLNYHTNFHSVNYWDLCTILWANTTCTLKYHANFQNVNHWDYFMHHIRMMMFTQCFKIIPD